MIKNITLRANVISRVLRKEFGIITVPDHTRQGFRVSQHGADEVAISVQIDSFREQDRTIEALTNSLQELGWTIRSIGDGILVVKRGQ